MKSYSGEHLIMYKTVERFSRAEPVTEEPIPEEPEPEKLVRDRVGSPEGIFGRRPRVELEEDDAHEEATFGSDASYHSSSSR